MLFFVDITSNTQKLFFISPIFLSSLCLPSLFYPSSNSKSIFFIYSSLTQYSLFFLLPQCHSSLSLSLYKSHLCDVIDWQPLFISVKLSPQYRFLFCFCLSSSSSSSFFFSLFMRSPLSAVVSCASFIYHSFHPHLLLRYKRNRMD